MVPIGDRSGAEGGCHDRLIPPLGPGLVATRQAAEPANPLSSGPSSREELNHDDDEGEDEEEVHEAAGGDASQEAERPQADENDGDGPEHGSLPGGMIVSWVIVR